MKKIKIGSDFSGVGAFNQALIRLGIKYDELFACDMDRYARQTYCLNFGNEQDLKLASQSILIQKACLDLFSFNFPTDVYEREIPRQSLDIYMTSPPCQAFSMAGKRLGKDDQRGILFFNSLEFIRENKPRYFIFENVKGLLSHDKQDKNAVYGRTFQEWINYLGGKSVNGNPVFFPYDDAVPYHIYFQVLNAKDYNIPQNRERIFIIGIRDDEDNNFTFPKPFPLKKRLKDVLETEVDEKYFLSDKMISGLIQSGDKKYINQDTQASQVFSENGITPSICAGTHGYALGYVETKIGTWRTHEDGKGFREMDDNLCPTIPARAREDGSGQTVIKIGAIRGRNPQNPKSRKSGLETEQMLEINENGTSNALTTVQKDNVVILGYTRDSKGNVTKRHEKKISGTLHTASGGGGNTDQFVIINSNTSKGYDEAEEEEEDSINFSVPNSKTRRGRVGKKVSQTLDTQCNQGIFTQQRIRRLTPTEAFRLMDFNFGIQNVPDFKWNVSDSQAYKQAGNSICVGVLAAIIERLKLD